MRAVVQRCSACTVLSEGEETGVIGRGLMVFLGVKKGDSEAMGDYLADKILNLRIFEDEKGKLNRSVLDIQGELMIVSQFTLYGDCRHGRRPGFSNAEEPERACVLYEYVVNKCRDRGILVKTGRFQTDMKVSLVNDGPVTILLDSDKLF